MQDCSTSMQGITSSLDQQKIVLKKNILVFSRNWKVTWCQLLCPLGIVVLLVCLQMVANDVLSIHNEYPKVERIAKLPRCQGNGCMTLLFAPPDVHWVKDVLSSTAIGNDLNYLTDFTPLPNASSRSLNEWCLNASSIPVLYPCHGCLPCRFLEDKRKLSDFIEAHQGLIHNAVHFQSAYLPETSSSLLPNDTGYCMYFNGTNSNPRSPIQVNDHSLELKRALDETLLKLKLGNEQAHLNVSWSTFPVVENRVNGIDVVAADGGVWFYLPAMVIFFVFLNEMVAEKEEKLRLNMTLMGLSNNVYWWTWFLTGFVFCGISSLILCLSGFIFQFDVFINSNVVVVFGLFLLFAIAMTALALFGSIFLHQTKTANTVGYAVVLVGFVFQTVLCSGYGILIDLILSDDVASWVVGIRWFCFLYPPFNYSKIYYDISTKSSTVYDYSEGKAIKGKGYFWNDLFVTSTKNFFGQELHIPSTINSFYYLLLDILIFLVLAWYFDQVLGGDTGSGRPFYFIFTKDYWTSSSTTTKNCSTKSSSFVPLKNNEHHNQEKQKKRKKLAFEEDDDDTMELAYTQVFQDDDDIDDGGDDDKDLDSDVEAEQSLVYATTSLPVRLLNLSKTFQKKSHFWKKTASCQVKALKGLSLGIAENEIFCLLGHNGAGKTTAINIMTGFLKSSGGEGYICGYSISNETDQVRKKIGVCPQYDVLWGELTAKEHLMIFAQLKGVPKESLEQQVGEKLQEVALTEVADCQVCTFSGGMKRRLSLAVAIIGDPKVLFLDEPTTGMDPVTRKEAWRMIQNMKKNRVIILTTHSMEEADCLGDRIAIMAHGRLHCIGNSLKLKHKFGSGYQIHVTSTHVQCHHDLIQEIQSHIQEAQVVDDLNENTLVVHVPYRLVEKIPALLEWLEKSEALGETIKGWGISHSTLESVFLEVTARAGFHYDSVHLQQDQRDQSNQNLALRSPIPTTNSIKSSLNEQDPSIKLCQTKEDDEKESKKKKKKKKKEVDSVDASVTSIDDSVKSIDDSVKSIDASKSIDDSFKNVVMVSSRQTRALFSKNMSLLKSERGQMCCQIVSPTFVMIVLLFLQMIISSELGPNRTTVVPEVPFPLNGNILQSSPTGECLEYFVHSVSNQSRNKVGYLSEDGKKSLLLGQIRQKLCPTVNDTTKTVPYFMEAYEDPKTMYQEVFKSLNFLNTIPLSDLDKKPIPSYLVPDGLVSFEEVKESSISYTFAVNDHRIAKYHRPNNFTRLDNEIVGRFNQSKVLLVAQGRLALLDMINKAFTSMLYPKRRSRFSEIMDMTIAITMSEKKTVNFVALMEVFISFLFPLALSLQLPIYLFLIVLEKEVRLREMQKCMGMSMLNYWIVNYVFDFLLYVVVVLFFWGCGLGMGLRFFTQTDPFLLLVLFVGWGLALVSLGFLCSVFVHTKRVALVLGYCISLFGTVVALVISDGIYGNIPGLSVGSNVPRWLLMNPLIGFTRAIYLMNFSCAVEQHCLNWGDVLMLSQSHTNEYLNSHGHELLQVLISLYLNGIFHLGLALYLDNVLPSPFGIPKHPFFLCKMVNSNKKNDHSTTMEEGMQLLGVEEDEDVIAERKRVLAAKNARDFPLLLKNLRKVYGAKVALDGLSIAIPEGETFGLLGENGAGKTTTFNILTGVFPSSDGNALICNMKVETNMSAIHQCIGVCPQHDILWESLTVKQHLLYYARLKGIASWEEEEHVTHALMDVGLASFSNRQAKELSGGMRRRLSIAISLIGNSQVVFLDEPTTGLDPTSRQQIWKIIEHAKKKNKKRVILLTTHSMDEAEVLSSRIGILTSGKLRCIGTSQHLKRKFGSGYHLEINYDPQCEDQVNEFLRERFPNSKVVNEYFLGHKELYLPVESIVSDIFFIMEKTYEQIGISDWAIGQITLEDAFHHVVQLYAQ